MSSFIWFAVGIALGAALPETFRAAYRSIRRQVSTRTLDLPPINRDQKNENRQEPS